MSGTGAVPGAIADAAPTMECYFCGRAPAVVYCGADAAGLCLPCDRHVHGANTVSCRHARAPLCAACRAAAATVRRGAARFLCSNCDFEEQQQHGEVTQPPLLLHDRGTVWRATPGAPRWASSRRSSASPSATVIRRGGLSGRSPRCSPSTTSSCGRPPAMASSPSLPRPLPRTGDRPAGSWTARFSGSSGSSPSRRRRRQSRPALISCLHGDLQITPLLGMLILGLLEPRPSARQQSCMYLRLSTRRRIAVDCSEAPERASAGSPAEPSLSSFVEVSEVCPGLSRSGSSADDAANGGHDHPPPTAPVAVQAQAPPAQASKSVGGYDVVYPDRDKVISRYKEKRKNRMYVRCIIIRDQCHTTRDFFSWFASAEC